MLAAMISALFLSSCSGKAIFPKGFLKVDGSDIVDAEGNPVWLKGIAHGNDVWSYPTEPVWTSQDESSYEDIASLGFNCVRFYMNYQVFEDDANPYNYKKSGFDWLDKNIKWAKKYGVRIILNMHVPQGGYQSQGGGTAMWTDEETQSRLIALWQEFAKRYADEETVIGYGILNEPIVPQNGSTEESVDQCRELMQRITDAIREYDENHIVFAERVCAVQNTVTGVSDWNIQISKLEFLLDDPNVVYEFHCYDPYSFTHQGMDWAGTLGTICKYPSETDNTLTKEYLEQRILQNIQFYQENNVPVYMGEFGAAVTACRETLGGEQWVADMIDICKEYGIHFTYHTYHETTFGLYQNSARELPAQRNDKLAEVFMQKFLPGDGE